MPSQNNARLEATNNNNNNNTEAQAWTSHHLDLEMLTNFLSKFDVEYETEATIEIEEDERLGIITETVDTEEETEEQIEIEEELEENVDAFEKNFLKHLATSILKAAHKKKLENLLEKSEEGLNIQKSTKSTYRISSDGSKIFFPIQLNGEECELEISRSKLAISGCFSDTHMSNLKYLFKNINPEVVKLHRFLASIKPTSSQTDIALWELIASASGNFKAAAYDFGDTSVFPSQIELHRIFEYHINSEGDVRFKISYKKVQYWCEISYTDLKKLFSSSLEEVEVEALKKELTYINKKGLNLWETTCLFEPIIQNITQMGITVHPAKTPFQQPNYCIVRLSEDPRWIIEIETWNHKTVKFSILELKDIKKPADFYKLFHEKYMQNSSANDHRMTEDNLKDLPPTVVRQNRALFEAFENFLKSLISEDFLTFDAETWKTLHKFFKNDLETHSAPFQNTDLLSQFRSEGFKNIDSYEIISYRGGDEFINFTIKFIPLHKFAYSTSYKFKVSLSKLPEILGYTYTEALSLPTENEITPVVEVVNTPEKSLENSSLTPNVSLAEKNEESMVIAKNQEEPTIAWDSSENHLIVSTLELKDTNNNNNNNNNNNPNSLIGDFVNNPYYLTLPTYSPETHAIKPIQACLKNKGMSLNMIMTSHISNIYKSSEYIHRDSPVYSQQNSNNHDPIRDFVDLMIKAGLKPGATVVVTLLVSEAAKSTGTNANFAKKLADAFAQQGINSKIIASMGIVKGFNRQNTRDGLVFSDKMGMPPGQTYLLDTTVDTKLGEKIGVTKMAKLPDEANISPINFTKSKGLQLGSMSLSEVIQKKPLVWTSVEPVDNVTASVTQNNPQPMQIK